MRQLVAGDREQLLAQELGDERRLGLIGDHAVRVVVRTLGEAAEDLGEQHVDAGAGARRDRDERVEVAELGRRAHELLADLVAARDVDLVDHEDLRRPDAPDEVGDEAVARTDDARWPR